MATTPNISLFSALTDQWSNPISVGGLPYYVENANVNGNAPWAISELNAQTLQFNLRPGDLWPDNGSNRTEIAGGTLYAPTSVLNISYQVTVQPGAIDPNLSWEIIGQLHSDDNSPITQALNADYPVLSFHLTSATGHNGGDYLAIEGITALPGQTNPYDVTTANNGYLYISPTPIVRGQPYSVQIQGSFQNNSNGYLDVWINGTEVVNYHGPIGYGASNYWKEGVYEGDTTTTPVTVDYADLSVSTGSVITNPAVAPTITGAVAGQATTSEATVKPFSGVTVADTNSGATDTVTITVGGAGGVLSGPTTLTGTAATITSSLRALSFTPNAGAAGTSSTTTFRLSDLSSAFATPTVNTTTSVVDTDPVITKPGVAPTIAGAIAAQKTTSEKAIKPFAGVTIGDRNSAASDTLTITLAGIGGALAGNGLTGGTGGVYKLTGTATTLTGELDALSFTPKAGSPNSTSTTTFELTDLSSAFATATVNTTTSVVDSDPAVAPTITGSVAGQTTTLGKALKAFSGVTVADRNVASTDTLAITVGGAGGVLSGTGLKDGTSGVYTLTGTAATVTSELDALVFTPSSGASSAASTTTFRLSDLSSAYPTATVNTTTTVVDNPVSAPTISGMVVTQWAGTAVKPFSRMTVTDPNSASTETLTITVQGAGVLSGTGLKGGSGGVYTLTGTPLTVSGELRALSLAQSAAAPAGPSAMTFKLSDVSSAYRSPIVETVSEIYSSRGDVAAEASNDGHGNGALVLSNSGLSVADSSTSLSVKSGATTFALAHAANETFTSTTRLSETFAFSAGFGVATMVGFDASGSGADSLSLQQTMFSYLTPGMSQAADLAAVLAHASSNSMGGVTITDTAGDSLAFQGVTKAMLTADASHIAFLGKAS
jgi:hypothetical protein